MPTILEKKKYLGARIDRWMESGEPELHLGYMLPEVEGDVELLKTFLFEWKTEGKIEWLLPIDPMDLTKPVVRFSHYITRHVLWRK